MRLQINTTVPLTTSGDPQTCTIPANVVLSHTVMRLENNVNCSFCRRERQSISHFFFFYRYNVNCSIVDGKDSLSITFFLLFFLSFFFLNRYNVNCSIVDGKDSLSITSFFLIHFLDVCTKNHPG